MQFCMAHKPLQPNVSAIRKITLSPCLQKKIFGCAEDLHRNDETLGSDASSGRAAPGRGGRNRGYVLQLVALAWPHWQGTGGTPQLGPCHIF